MIKPHFCHLIKQPFRSIGKDIIQADVTRPPRQGKEVHGSIMCVYDREGWLSGCATSLWVRIIV